MAISISIVGDAASAIREAERTGTALSDVVSELEQLDAAGRDSADGMVRSLGDASTSAGELAGDLDRAAAAGEDLGRVDAGELARDLDRAAAAGEDLGRVDAGTLARDLDDAGDAARDMGKRVEDAADGADRFEARMRDALRAAEAQASAAGRKIGTSVDDGFDKASAGAEEFKDEAAGTAREAAASFDGSADSIGDAFQEVAANAFAGFGPAGAIAGMAIAAGIGIGIAKLNELAEENTAAAEDAAALGDAYIEAGGRIEALDIPGMIRAWGQEVSEDKWLTFWKDEAEANFTAARDAAVAAGVDVGDALAGMGGSAEDSARMLEELAEQERILAEQVEAGTVVLSDGVTWLDESARAAQDKLGAVQELRAGVEENSARHEEAKEIEELYAESIRGTVEEVKAKNDVLNETADILGGAIESELDYRAAVDETTAAIEENGATLDTSTEQGRDNWQQLLDLADASREFRDAQTEAGVPTSELSDLMAVQRQRFIEAAEAAGMEAAEARALADQLGLVPTDIHTDFRSSGAPEIKRHQEDILSNENIGVSVKFNADTYNVDAALDRIRGSMSNLSKNFRNWM